MWVDACASLSNEGVPITSVWTKYDVEVAAPNIGLVSALASRFQKNIASNDDALSNKIATDHKAGVRQTEAFIEIFTAARAILVIEKEGIFRRLCEDYSMK